MTRSQFSLGGMIAGVIIIAAACAALTSNLAFVASTVVTIQYILLALGIVGIVARQGADRLFWVGFVVFGLIYRHAADLAMSDDWFSRNPRFASEAIVTDEVLELAFNQKRFSPRVGAIVEGEWTPGHFYAAKVTQINDDGTVLLTWLDGSSPKWVPATGVRWPGDWRAFRSTGHSVFTILASLIGGFVAMLIFATKPNGGPQRNQLPQNATTSRGDTA